MLISKINTALFVGAILLSASAIAVPPPQDAGMAVCTPGTGTSLDLVCKTPDGDITLSYGSSERTSLPYQELKTMAKSQTSLPCNIFLRGYNGTQPVSADGGSLVFDLHTPNVVAIVNIQFKPIPNVFKDFYGNPVAGYLQFILPSSNTISYADTTCPSPPPNKS